MKNNLMMALTLLTVATSTLAYCHEYKEKSNKKYHRYHNDKKRTSGKDTRAPLSGMDLNL